MSGYGQCPDCGGETVEVDNPMRREVRHRRGVGAECVAGSRAFEKRMAELAERFGPYLIPAPSPAVLGLRKIEPEREQQ